VRGSLAAGLVAHSRRIPGIVATDADPEAALAGGDVCGVRSLAEAVTVSIGDPIEVRHRPPLTVAATDDDTIDLADVRVSR